MQITTKSPRALSGTAVTLPSQMMHGSVGRGRAVTSAFLDVGKPSRNFNHPIKQSCQMFVWGELDRDRLSARPVSPRFLRFELGRIPFPLCHIHGLLRLIDRILLGGSKVGDHLSIQRVKGRAMQGGRSRRQTFAFPYRDSLGRPPSVSRHNPVHELIE